MFDCLGSDWELSDLIICLECQKWELAAIRKSNPASELDMWVARIIKMVNESMIIVLRLNLIFLPEEILVQPFVGAVVLREADLTPIGIARCGGPVDARESGTRKTVMLYRMA